METIFFGIFTFLIIFVIIILLIALKLFKVERKLILRIMVGIAITLSLFFIGRKINMEDLRIPLLGSTPQLETICHDLDNHGETLPFRDLIEDANYIVRGRVTGTLDSFLIGEGINPLVFTPFEIEVLDVFKGDIQPESIIVFNQLGGRIGDVPLASGFIGDVSTINENLFHVGDDLLVLLNYNHALNQFVAINRDRPNSFHLFDEACLKIE